MKTLIPVTTKLAPSEELKSQCRPDQIYVISLVRHNREYFERFRRTHGETALLFSSRSLVVLCFAYDIDSIPQVFEKYNSQIKNLLKEDEERRVAGENVEALPAYNFAVAEIWKPLDLDSQTSEKIWYELKDGTWQVIT